MTGTFDTRLVALSVLVATLTAFAALNLVQRVGVSRPAAARTWLTGGAIAVGAGIWSMHYIGMLALRLPIPVDYHVPTMLFSLGIAMLICFFALWVASGPRTGLVRIAVAGACLAIGLACMHYSGLFAMQIVPAIFYSPTLVAVSVGIAAVASWLLLWLGAALRDGHSLAVLLGRAAAAVLIGVALGAMHYVGMLAARFAPDSYSLGAVAGQASGNDFLDVLATAAALGVLAVLLLTIIDHPRQLLVIDPRSGQPEKLATRDPQTGLVNQATLAHGFDDLVEAARGSGQIIAMLVIDLDTASASGYPAGQPARDGVLREVAARLGTLVRPGDTVARLEQGDFALMLVGLTDAAQVERVAARVLEEIGREIVVEAAPVRLLPTLGSALYPADGQDTDTLLRIARAARHKA